MPLPYVYLIRSRNGRRMAMKRILSFMLAALLLAGCAGPGGGVSENKTASPGAEGGTVPAKMNYVLSEPIYPEFPKEPQMPVEGSEGEWKAYSEAYEKYIDALHAIRGENSGLTDRQKATLNIFAAKSTPLAIASHGGENVVYSPLSLWSALAMLAQCASGDSRRQALDALGAEDVYELREGASRVWRTLYTDDGQSSLILSNSIWLNGNLRGTYVQETLDVLAEQYYSSAYSVPMGTDAADSAVTEWVSKQTNDLIGSGAPVVKTNPETLALLASSLYYKAAWTEEFMADRTQEDTFTAADGQESQVDFMHQTQSGSFLRRENWRAAQLGTSLGRITFVLPDEGISPESLLQNPDFLSELDFSAEHTVYGEVQWSVPKFDVDSSLDLMDALKAMGVTDLTDMDRADLTALTDLDAYLSEAKQLARVKVDEEGVEAAAVTILEIDECCALPPVEPEVCVMDLDRPFLFVIRTQDVPLFIGIVNQV